MSHLKLVQSRTSEQCLYSVLLEYTGPDFTGALPLCDLERLSGVTDAVPLLLKLQGANEIQFLEIVENCGTDIAHWQGAVSYDRYEEYQKLLAWESELFSNWRGDEKIVAIGDGVPF